MLFSDVNRIDIAQLINKLGCNRRFIYEPSAYRLFDCCIPSRFAYQLVRQFSIRFYLKWGHVGRELATFNRTSSSLSLFLLPSPTPFSVTVPPSLSSLHLSISFSGIVTVWRQCQVHSCRAHVIYDPLFLQYI